MSLQVVQITPPALRNIGYKTYIIFAVFNFVNACIVWAFYPETAGLTLESVDDLFRRDDEPAGSRKFGLQWPIVERAAATVERDRAVGVEGAVRSGMAREKESVEGRGERLMSLYKYIHDRDDGYEYLLRQRKAMPA